ncbi:MAG: hypothetical protein ACI9U0_001857 [Flavobacteriales bacterium]|jgi:hypothetical protein
MDSEYKKKRLFNVDSEGFKYKLTYNSKDNRDGLLLQKECLK